MLRKAVAQVRSVRWASVATVVGAALVAVVCVAAVLRGRVWAWVPFGIAAAIVVREVRYLQRARRRHATFDEPDRRSEGSTSRRRAAGRARGRRPPS